MLAPLSCVPPSHAVLGPKRLASPVIYYAPVRLDAVCAVWAGPVTAFLLHIDNPQKQGITVAPLNVELGYRSAGAGVGVRSFRLVRFGLSGF